jgi:hypothetical protein
MTIDYSNTTKIRDNSSNDRIAIGSRDLLLGGGSALAASALIGEVLFHANPAQAQTPTALPSDEIGEVAISAYIYAYPLIVMEITRRVSTNVADASHFGKAPMNQFANLPAFPDATIPPHHWAALARRRPSWGYLHSESHHGWLEYRAHTDQWQS